MNRSLKALVGALVTAGAIAPISTRALEPAYINVQGPTDAIAIVDLDTGSVIRSQPVAASSLQGIDLSGDGSRLWIADFDAAGSVTVYDAPALTPIATIPVGSFPQSVLVLNARNEVWVAGWTGEVSVIDGATFQVVATINVAPGDALYQMAASPGEDRVFLANSSANTVVVLDTTTRTVATTIPLADFPFGLALSPDGTRLYVSGGDAWHVIDAVNHQLLSSHPMPGLGPLYALALQPGGSRLYITAAADSSVKVVDLASEQIVASVPRPGTPVSIDFSADGSKAVVCAYLAGGGTSVIDTATLAVQDAQTGPSLSYGSFVGPRIPTGSEVPTLGTTAAAILVALLACVGAWRLRILG